MKLSVLLIPILGVACEGGADPHAADQGGGTCDELSRVAYEEAEPTLDEELVDHVSLYLELHGAWIAQASCIDGDTGEVHAFVDTSSTEDMEVVTYEGSACGELPIRVLAATDLEVTSDLLAVVADGLEASITASEQTAVIDVLGTADDGTDVLIEVTATGVVTATTKYITVSDNEKVVDTCTLSGWVREDP